MDRGRGARARDGREVRAAAGAAERPQTGRRHPGVAASRGGLALRRALGKRELRVAAIDDGPFTRRHRRAPLVAVVVVAPGRLEAVALGAVAVDGTDATERIAELLGSTGQLEGVRAVLLDGISFGGFNLVDLPRLARRLERPVVAVTDRRPDLPAIRAALAKHFPGELALRWGRVRRAPLRRVPTPGGALFAAVAGAPAALVEPLLARTVVRGRWPEPLAMAHRIARALGRPVRAGRPSPRGRDRGTRRGPGAPGPMLMARPVVEGTGL